MIVSSTSAESSDTPSERMLTRYSSAFLLENNFPPRRSFALLRSDSSSCLVAFSSKDLAMFFEIFVFAPLKIFFVYLSKGIFSVTNSMNASAIPTPHTSPGEAPRATASAIEPPAVESERNPILAAPNPFPKYLAAVGFLVRAPIAIAAAVGII